MGSFFLHNYLDITIFVKRKVIIYGNWYRYLVMTIKTISKCTFLFPNISIWKREGEVNKRPYTRVFLLTVNLSDTVSKSVFGYFRATKCNSVSDESWRRKEVLCCYIWKKIFITFVNLSFSQLCFRFLWPACWSNVFWAKSLH